jgi:hypothetical protein
MHQTFMKRIATKAATPFALEVWRVVSDLELHAKRVCSTYMSPLNKTKLISWEEQAYKHQLKAGKPTFVDVFRVLGIWYTALRLLVQSWEEDEVLAMQWLKVNNALSAVHGTNVGAIQKACETPDSFYKLGRLRYHLIKKREAWGGSFRCIVFVQQRIAAYVISCFIQSDEELKRHKIVSGFVTARDGTITPEIKMTKSMKQETVAAFRSGTLNVIVATSVLEEVCDRVFEHGKPDQLTIACYLNIFRALMCQRPMS